MKNLVVLYLILISFLTSAAETSISEGLRHIEEKMDKSLSAPKSGCSSDLIPRPKNILPLLTCQEIPSRICSTPSLENEKNIKEYNRFLDSSPEFAKVLIDSFNENARELGKSPTSKLEEVLSYCQDYYNVATCGTFFSKAFAYVHQKVTSSLFTPSTISRIKEVLKKVADREITNLGSWFKDNEHYKKKYLDYFESAEFVVGTQKLEPPFISKDHEDYEKIKLSMREIAGALCGKSGQIENAAVLKPNAISKLGWNVYKNKAIVLVCPLLVIKQTGLDPTPEKIIEQLTFVLGHEMAHPIHYEEKHTTKKLQNCLKNKYKWDLRKSFSNYVDEISADYFGLSALATVLMERKPPLSRQEAFLKLQESLHLGCSTIGVDDGIHPPAEYRLGHLLLSNPDVSKLLDCPTESEGGSPLCSFQGHIKTRD